jgi:phosphatidylcholine synthase
MNSSSVIAFVADSAGDVQANTSKTTSTRVVSVTARILLSSVGVIILRGHRGNTMSGSVERPAHGPLPRLAAWSVHLLTASGAVWALLALDAAARAHFKAALGWMAVAVLVDGVDGALARRARVKVLLPSLDGTLLDNLVDYLNYVVVPAFLIYRAGLLPQPAALAGAAAICLASAFQFAQLEAKAGDRFRGFPSYWNVVALYLLLLRPAGWVALGVVVALCLLVFVPVPWIYPTRTRELRGPTLTLTIVWAATVGVLLWRYPDHPRWLAHASLAYAVYYIALSLWLWRRAGYRDAGSDVSVRPAGTSPGSP